MSRNKSAFSFLYVSQIASDMADPFSIIGVVSAGLKAIVQAKAFVDSIGRAPRSIQALSDELLAIENLLRELSSLLNKFDESTRESANRLARDALTNCEKISRQIEREFRPFVKSSRGINTWKRFSFAFQESDVEDLKRDMSQCKQTLTMAIGCVNLYVEF
jgi:hypothetical protein